MKKRTSYSRRTYNSWQPKGRAVKPRRSHKLKLVVGVIILLIIFLGLTQFVFKKTAGESVSLNSKTSSTKTAVAVAPPKPSICATNSAPQMIFVSISQRHMWACAGATQVYDSPVITGMENLAADLTPTGTYTIYAKIRDTHLIGHDSTGSWNDYVNYWMPFLSNQYGIYGFHDATWRAPSDFGNISPYSSNASHGCVEMPLAAATWLYNWGVIGTSLTINS